MPIQFTIDIFGINGANTPSLWYGCDLYSNGNFVRNLDYTKLLNNTGLLSLKLNANVSDTEINYNTVKFTVLYSNSSSSAIYNSISFDYTLSNDTIVTSKPTNLEIAVSPSTATNKYIKIHNLAFYTVSLADKNINIINSFDNSNSDTSAFQPVTITAYPVWFDTTLIPATNITLVSLPPPDFINMYPVIYKVNNITVNTRCKLDHYDTEIDLVGGTGGIFNSYVYITPNYIEHKGYVLDSNGKSIKNANITITRVPNNNVYTTLTKNVSPFVTNSIGYFEFYDIMNSAVGYSASLTVAAQHFNSVSSVSKSYALYSTETYNTVLTRKTHTLSGTVKNILGNGVKGAALTLVPDNTVDNPASTVVVVTDATGAYGVNPPLLVEEGTYSSLTCSKTGVTSQTITNLSELESTNAVKNFTNFNELVNVAVNVTDYFTTAIVNGTTVRFDSTSTNGQHVTLPNYNTGKLIPDVYTMTVSKTGYTTYTETTDLTTGLSLYTFNVRILSNTAVLSGNVISADTNAILKSATINISGGGINRTISTDNSGNYREYLFPGYTYTLTCSYPGLVTSIKTLVISTAGFYIQDFALSTLGVGFLTGIVTNTAVSPLPVENVTIKATNSLFYKNALTSPDGIYNTQVKEGTYAIEAYKTYYTPQIVQNVFVPSGQTASYNFTSFARTVGDVTGWVKDDLGNYLNEAYVSYLTYNDYSTPTYILENIAPIAGVFVTASLSGYYLASTGFDIIVDTAQNANITMDRYRAKIHGYVLDSTSNQPVVPCDIYTNYLPNKKWQMQNSGGYVSDTYLPVGTLRVTADPKNGINVRAEQIVNIPNRTSDVEVNFSLTSNINCKIYGYTYFTINNKKVPLDGVSILIESTTTSTVVTGISNLSGYYIIPLSPDTWSITVSKDGFTSQSIEITVAENQSVKQDFTLISSLPVARLSGYVKGSDSKRIKSQIDFGADTVYFSVTPSISGYYIIEDIPPNTYLLKAYHNIKTKLYSDLSVNLSFSSGENKNYNFILPALFNFNDYTNWTYKNELIGNGTIMGSYIDTIKFDGGLDVSENVYDETNLLNYTYAPYVVDFNSTDPDFVQYVHRLNDAATYDYNFIKFISMKYGTELLSDIYTPISHPTAANFNILATAHTTLNFNKDIISYSPAASYMTTDYSVLPDITYTGSINIKSHNFDITVLNDRDVANNAITDLYTKTIELHQFYENTTPTPIPTTMSLYASALPTTLNVFETSAFSNIGVATYDVYILGGKTYLEEQSNNFYKLTPTAVDSNPNIQYISATSLGDTPGKARYGGISFNIDNKIYYGMGVVATWLGIPYHLDTDKVPSSGYEFKPEEEHLYGYGLESICGVDNTEFYAFSGYNNFYKYTGSWINLTPSRTFPISSYCHSKLGHLEFDPSHFVYNSLYETNTGNILITRFDKGYNPINVKLVATGNVPTAVKPMFTNSHSLSNYTNIPDWNIFIDDAYDATPTIPSLYCMFSYSYPVNGVRWRYNSTSDWQIAASYTSPVNAGAFTITPSEINTDALVIRNYEFQGLSSVKNSLIASTSAIAIDKIAPIASILPLHTATNTGKYFTEYIYGKDLDTSVVEMYAAGVASTVSSTVYQNVYQATISYGAYSRSIFPGVATLSYKFTPSYSTSGYNQVWHKTIDACGNSFATYYPMYVDTSITDTIAPSLLYWNRPSIANALSLNIPSIMDIRVYDGVQLNDIQYRYSKNNDAYENWINIYYNSTDYKTGTFSLDTLTAGDGYYTYNIKVSDTSLNIATFIATYLVDSIYPITFIYDLHGGTVNYSTNATDNPDIVNSLIPQIEIDYFDNYWMATAWCNFDGVAGSRMFNTLTGTKLYQKWQPQATLTQAFHYFTAYAQDLAGNVATSNYYILGNPTRTYYPTGFQLHRNEVVEL